MNDKHTLRDDWEDRLAEQALGELLGGKRPPDLSERILAAVASQPLAAKRRPRARLALAASLLLVAGLGGGYAAYQKLHQLGSTEDGKGPLASRQEPSRSTREPSEAPVDLEQVGGGIKKPAPKASTRAKSPSQDVVKEKVAMLVDEFNTLMDEHRWAEAELVAKKAREVAPDEPVVKQIGLMVKMTSRTNAVADIRNAEEQGFYQATNNTDLAAIPFDDKKPYQFGSINDWERLTRDRYAAGRNRSKLAGAPASGESPILYPDPEVWQRLAERHKKYKAVDSTDNSSTEAEVIAALDDKTELEFVDQPLSDIIEYLRERHGIEIQVDNKVMTDSGLGAETPITRNIKGVTLRSALRLMLGEMDLTYVIRDGVLMITTKAEAETLLLAKVYPVGDLVIRTKSSDEGRGPGEGGDRYSRIIENPFLGAVENPLSTFSIDVDTASYAKVRRYLLEENVLPPPDAVRIEELVNYFSYDLPQPEGEAPFAAKLEAAACPWQPKHRLLRVSLKTREIAAEARPAANLVFLLDVSGSMQPEDKLPRVRRAMRLLTEQLREQDRVAIVVYAGSSGLVLPSTSGFQKEKILSALESLAAGGSTNGGEGLVLAYETATANFIKQGVNRVILCTDGDFNVGTTSDGELERLIEAKAKTGVFLTVLGFGMGNHNDQMLEKLADKGNGNYGYIDTEDEARKLLVEQAGGTLVTVAKDVKLQLEFNPRQVAAYRLIGYEDRLLRAEDFNNDHKDAGEIGAGHSVTALYELIPAAKAAGAAGDKAAGEVEAEPLKYQRPASLTDAAGSGELLTLKIKYKAPDSETSKAALVFTTRDEGQGFAKASADFKFAAAVASFGMLLRNSEYQGDFSYDAVLEIAQEGLGADAHGYRQAFLGMVRKAKELAVAKSR